MSWVEGYFAAWARHAQASEPISGMADRERLLAFLAPDVHYEDVPTGQIFTGHDGVIRMGAQALLMASDIRFTCISLQQSSDQFAFETTTHGTNTGAVGAFPATGKSFVLRGVSVGTRTPQGTVVSHKDYWDLAGYLRQIGLLPPG
ncbi:MAG: ester cyclase [Candidatus Binatia bacterium]